jgi:hypothetical protein
LNCRCSTSRSGVCGAAGTRAEGGTGAFIELFSLINRSSSSTVEPWYNVSLGTAIFQL